jgi:hypothetical protein
MELDPEADESDAIPPMVEDLDHVLDGLRLKQRVPCPDHDESLGVLEGSPRLCLPKSPPRRTPSGAASCALDACDSRAVPRSRQVTLVRRFEDSRAQGPRNRPAASP